MPKRPCFCTRASHHANCPLPSVLDPWQRFCKVASATRLESSVRARRIPGPGARSLGLIISEPVPLGVEAAAVGCWQHYLFEVLSSPSYVSMTLSHPLGECCDLLPSLACTRSWEVWANVNKDGMSKFIISDGVTASTNSSFSVPWRDPGAEVC